MDEIVYIQTIVILTVFLGLIAMLTYRILNKYFITQNEISKIHLSHKNKISLKKTITIIIKSKPIRLIISLLILYGISINSIDYIWKEKFRQSYPKLIDNITFSGVILKYTGVFTVLFSIIGSYITRKSGWLISALIAPSFTLLCGLMFLVQYNFFKDNQILFFSINISISTFVLGATQNVVSKVVKYTFFDSTKEMFYVPLNNTEKTQGKACAEVLGSKTGKSISSLIQSFMLSVVPGATFVSISLQLTLIFTFSCLLWIYTVIQINKIYSKKIKN